MQLIYNVTVKVDNHIAEPWLEWLLNEHIPEVMATKCFKDFKAMRILELDAQEGPTFAVQYFAESEAHYHQYIEQHAAALRKKTTDKWGAGFVAFRTLMQVVK